MTLRDPKKCEICGELFIPKQGRSRICNDAECAVIDQRKRMNARALSNAKKPFERSCTICGSAIRGQWNAKFCRAAKCQLQRQEIERNRDRQLKRSLRDENIAPIPRQERPLDRSIIVMILEGWINTIFTERDQVELVFLESSHLRGCRNSLISSDLCYNGGYIGEGIFPNRGARA